MSRIVFATFFLFYGQVLDKAGAERYNSTITEQMLLLFFPAVMMELADM
jgi:hypothetical protein